MKMPIKNISAIDARIKAVLTLFGFFGSDIDIRAGLHPPFQVT